MSDENAAKFSNGSVDAAGLRPWVVVLFVSLSGCAFGGGLMATGEVGGHALSGPVDHQVARAYLEKSALPTPLRRLRTSMLSSRRVPSPATLAEVSRVYSPDVATLLLLEAMSAQPSTQALRKRYEEELQFVDRVGLDQARPTFPEDLLVLMVPGWFYASHGAETNADFRIQRQLYREWGVAHRLVEIQENGSVEENAKIVAAAIRAASNQRVFVVSASKSGAEVAQALGRELRTEETSHVVGWLSIVGVVRGSALADRVLEPDLCWLVRAQLALEGFGLEGLLSLRASSGRDTFAGLRLPPKVPVYSIVAIPLSGHISDRGAFGYARLRSLGPNDGLTLLSDELIPGATPLILPGVDHFLGAQDQRVWSTAILRVMLGHLPTNS
jgi:hypothetical protein